jgi:hypothetical protein
LKSESLDYLNQGSAVSIISARGLLAQTGTLALLYFVILQNLQYEKLFSDNEKLIKLLCILFSIVGNNGIENLVQALKGNVENC